MKKLKDNVLIHKEDVRINVPDRTKSAMPPGANAPVTTSS